MGIPNIILRTFSEQISAGIPEEISGEFSNKTWAKKYSTMFEIVSKGVCVKNSKRIPREISNFKQIPRKIATVIPGGITEEIHRNLPIIVLGKEISEGCHGKIS